MLRHGSYARGFSPEIAILFLAFGTIFPLPSQLLPYLPARRRCSFKSALYVVAGYQSEFVALVPSVAAAAQSQRLVAS